MSRKGKNGYKHKQDARVPWIGRLNFTMLFLCVMFATIGVRLVNLGLQHKSDTIVTQSQTISSVISRPDILDRNGHLLATDIRTVSLTANPKKIVSKDEVIEKLIELFPDLSSQRLRKILSKNKDSVTVKRGLTPAQHARVHNLGLAGVDFDPEPHRVYPSGSLASHILGYVDVDNKGSSGIESYIDKITGLYLPKTNLNSDKPVVELSLDIGVQHILRRELATAMELYQAKAASGIILDVASGEVVSLVSLPDFNPHIRSEAVDKDRFNRISYNVVEMGSVFKIITTAMALNYGVVNINSGFDTSSPIKVRGHTINDYKGQKRWLNIREIFTYSSNIGTAKMAMSVGTKRHKAFLKRLGLLEPLQTELGSPRSPVVPKHWSDIHTMTVSFGHGLSVTPLQFASAVGSLVNGGYYIPPTFLKRSRAKGIALAKGKMITSATSDHIRELLRLNVLKGTGKRADAKGYRVGGKTGTAEKVVNGRYDGDKLLTSFVSVFPVDDPAYVVLLMLDEPQAAPGQKSRPTAGTNVAPLTGRVISQIANKLGVLPHHQTAKVHSLQ